jgi:hypothetical protein
MGEVFGMHHELGRSAEDNMNKTRVIGHFFLKKLAIDGGGGVVGGVTPTIASVIGPWFRSPKPGYNLF